MPEKPTYISNRERKARAKRERHLEQQRMMIESLPAGMKEKALEEFNRLNPEGGAGAGGGGGVAEDKP